MVDEEKNLPEQGQTVKEEEVFVPDEEQEAAHDSGRQSPSQEDVEGGVVEITQSGAVPNEEESTVNVLPEGEEDGTPFDFSGIEKGSLADAMIEAANFPGFEENDHERSGETGEKEGDVKSKPIERKKKGGVFSAMLPLNWFSKKPTKTGDNADVIVVDEILEPDTDDSVSSVSADGEQRSEQSFREVALDMPDENEEKPLLSGPVAGEEEQAVQRRRMIHGWLSYGWHAVWGPASSLTVWLAKYASGYAFYEGARVHHSATASNIMVERLPINWEDVAVQQPQFVPDEIEDGIGEDDGEDSEDEKAPLMLAPVLNRKPNSQVQRFYKKVGKEWHLRTRKSLFLPDYFEDVVLRDKKGKVPKIHWWQNPDGTLALPTSSKFFIFTALSLAVPLLAIAAHKFSTENDVNKQLNPAMQNALGSEKFKEVFLYAVGEAFKATAGKVFSKTGFAIIETIMSMFISGKTLNNIRRGWHNWYLAHKRDKALGIKPPSKCNVPGRLVFNLERAHRGPDLLKDPYMGSPVNDALLLSWTTFFLNACYRSVRAFNDANSVDVFKNLVPGNPGPFPTQLLPMQAENYAITKAFEAFINTWGAGRYGLLGVTGLVFLSQALYALYNKRYETKLFNRTIYPKVSCREDGTLIVWLTPAMRLKIVPEDRLEHRNRGFKEGRNATLTRYMAGRKYKGYLNVGYEVVREVVREVEVLGPERIVYVKAEPVPVPEVQSEQPKIPTGGVPMFVDPTATLGAIVGNRAGMRGGIDPRLFAGALQASKLNEDGTPLLGGGDTIGGLQLVVEDDGEDSDNGERLGESVRSGVADGDVSPVESVAPDQSGAATSLVSSRAALFNQRAQKGTSGSDNQDPRSTCDEKKWQDPTHSRHDRRGYRGGWQMDVVGGPHGGTVQTASGLPPTKEEAKRMIAQEGGVGGNLKLGFK